MQNKRLVSDLLESLIVKTTSLKDNAMRGTLLIGDALKELDIIEDRLNQCLERVEQEVNDRDLQGFGVDIPN